jgi:di/tricarboxylate transporter
VIAIARDGTTILMPDAEEALREGDLLVVTANPDDLRVLRALQRLEIEDGVVPNLTQLETDRVGLQEVVLAPRATIVGKTLRQLHFREKMGLSVLAIWREGRPLRANLRDVPLQFGDDLLVFGPRSRLRVLASEPDFIGLSQAMQPEPRTKLAPAAIAGLAVALLPAMFGWLEISVSVLMGATFVVLARCLTPDEAYRGVELSAIVLVAALIPLKLALENTEAAGLVADALLNVFEPMGPRGVLAALCLMTALGSQAIPAPALVVLMAPIAITAAETAGLSPHALIMGVALSASGLASPVGHPANALVMGPGGYRYIDYVKLGLPLTAMILLIVIFIMPLVWPLQ